MRSLVHFGLAAILLAGCGGSHGGTSSGGFSIKVTNAQWQYGIGSARPASGRSFAVITVSINNGSLGHPLLAAAPLFSITTKAAISVPISSYFAGVDSPCSNLSVAKGGTLACSLAFEVPTGDVPVELDYDDKMGDTATVTIEAVARSCPASGWTNASTSQCVSCSSSASCPQAKSCTMSEATCISNALAGWPSSLCSLTRGCTLSASCAAEIEQYVDCINYECDESCR
jgi:hypothetical protein